jgi:transketolase
MGTTDEVIGLGDIRAKFEAFGFDAISVDGHDETAIDQAYQTLKTRNDGRPKAMVARTVKGKGVSFMEHENIWHYTRLTAQTYEAAIAELGEKR